MGSTFSRSTSTNDAPKTVSSSSSFPLASSPSSHSLQSSSAAPAMTLAVRTWNIAAGATVVLPLVFFFLARAIVGDERRNDDGGGEGEQREGGFWSWWGGNNREGGEGGEDREGEGGFWAWFSGREGRGPDEQGQGALIFAYIWALLLFAALVWFGNQVLGSTGKEKERSTSALFVALVAFSNLAFLCWILVQNQMQELREEDRWISQFPAAMVLTFLSWILFGVVYAILLQRKYGAMEQLGPKDNTRRNSGYQRTNDDGDIV